MKEGSEGLTYSPLIMTGWNTSGTIIVFLMLVTNVVLPVTSWLLKLLSLISSTFSFPSDGGKWTSLFAEGGMMLLACIGLITLLLSGDIELFIMPLLVLGTWVGFIVSLRLRVSIDLS